MNTIRDKTGLDRMGQHVQNMGHGFASVIHALRFFSFGQIEKKPLSFGYRVDLKKAAPAAGEKATDWICAKCIYVIQPSCLFYTKITFCVSM